MWLLIKSACYIVSNPCSTTLSDKTNYYTISFTCKNINVNLFFRSTIPDLDLVQDPILDPEDPALDPKDPALDPKDPVLDPG